MHGMDEKLDSWFKLKKFHSLKPQVDILTKLIMSVTELSTHQKLNVTFHDCYITLDKSQAILNEQ